MAPHRSGLIYTRLALAFFAATSVAGNVIGAWPDGWVARGIAPFPPLVLWIVIEAMTVWYPIERLDNAPDIGRMAICLASGAGALGMALANLSHLAEAANHSREAAVALLAMNEGGLIAMTLNLWKSSRARQPEPVEPEPVELPPAAEETSVLYQAPTTEKDDRRRQLAAMDLTKPDLKELANRFGCSVRTIQRDLEQLEVPQ